MPKIGSTVDFRFLYLCLASSAWSFSCIAKQGFGTPNIIAQGFDHTVKTGAVIGGRINIATQHQPRAVSINNRLRIIGLAIFMPGRFAHDGAAGIGQIGLLVRFRRPWRLVIVIIFARRLFQPSGGGINLGSQR